MDYGQKLNCPMGQYTTEQAQTSIVVRGTIAFETPEPAMDNGDDVPCGA